MTLACPTARSVFQAGAVSPADADLQRAFLSVFGDFLDPALAWRKQFPPLDEVKDTDLAPAAKKEILVINLEGSESLRLDGFGQNIAPGGTASLADAFKDIEFRIKFGGSVVQTFKRFQVGELANVARIRLVATPGQRVVVEIEHTGAANTHTVGIRLTGWFF